MCRLLLQKKNFADTVSGTLKTIMGFVVLGGGATILIGALDVFGKMFDKAFHIKGIIPNNEAVVVIAQQTLGKETAFIMVFGMLVNLLIARFTKFKYVFLTGHHTLFMACLISAAFSTTGMKGFSLVMIGSIVLGSLMVIFPALLQPYVRKITGMDDIAIGHFGSVGYLAAVFRNATGGRRGAILGSFVNGLLISFLPALLLPVLGGLGFENTTFGDSDFAVVGILISEIAKLLGSIF